MTASQNLKLRRDAAVATGVATRGIYAARAENAELWDVDGKRFIDFAAGIAVNNTGHRHPKVMQAVAEQGSTNASPRSAAYAESRVHTKVSVEPSSNVSSLSTCAVSRSE